MPINNVDQQAAIEALNNLKKGQELEVFYFNDSPEKAYFVAPLEEEELRGKFLVILEEKYQTAIIDANTGQLTGISDDFPFSEKRFDLMERLAATVTPDDSGDRPEVVTTNKPLFEAVDEIITNLKDAQGDFSSLSDEEAAKFLTQSRDLLNERVDFIETQEDVDLILQIESELSDQLNTKSDFAEQVDSAEVDEDNDSLGLTENEDDTLLANGVLSAAVDGEDFDPDALPDDELPTSQLLSDELDLLDEQTIDRKDDDPTLPHGQAAVAQGPGSFGLGDAVGALIRGTGSVISYTGSSLARMAELGEVRGQERFQQGLERVKERGFEKHLDSVRENIAAVDQMREAIIDPRIAGLLDAANVSAGNDVELETAKQTAIRDLRETLDSDRSYRDAMVAVTKLGDSLYQLETFRESRDPDNAAKAEIVEGLFKDAGDSIDEFKPLTAGDEFNQEKLESMSEAIKNLVAKIKDFLAKLTSSSKGHTVQSAPAPGA